MPVHAPGPELGKSIPFKHLGMKGGHGRKGVAASLNLTAMVDMMTMLVVFLLSVFSAQGKITLSHKSVELPKAIYSKDLQRAPIITITKDTIAFTSNNESVDVANPQTLTEDEGAQKLTDLQELLTKTKKDAEDQAAAHSSGDAQKDADVGTYVILQADKATDVKVINQVIQTAHAAGYINVMFVVAKKGK